MNQCTISGCRLLQTTCVTCGRIVCTKALPAMLEWVKMTDQEPPEGNILYISKEEATEPQMGIACPEARAVLLRRTDIEFEDILYWSQIPEVPK